MNVIDGANVVKIVCKALNKVDSRLVDHGERVAYILYKMLECDGGWNDKEIADICILGIFHDIGAYKTSEINGLMNFEVENPWQHAIYGYLFMKYMTPLQDKADAVLYHHLDYNKFPLVECKYPQIAQLINLADRLDLTIQQQGLVANKDLFANHRDKKFSGELIDLFLRAEQKNHIVVHLLGETYSGEVANIIRKVKVEQDELAAYLQMLVYSIDFRSEATVVHTITTVNISVEIAKVMGLGAEDVQNIYFGSLLHDIGKIAIPVEILEFPGTLSPQEMQVMKTHVSISEEILQEYINPVICRIAVRHHEKLNGKGYPRGLMGDQMTMSEKIVAVSDVLSALSGRRSYKVPFSKERCISILQQMSDSNQISKEVTEAVVQNYDAIMAHALKSCENKLKMYHDIKERYDTILGKLKDL